MDVADCHAALSRLHVGRQQPVRLLHDHRRALFRHRQVTFKVTTTAAQAIPNERTYHRFSDLADDVVDARIYMGIHFRFADTAARKEGTRVATQAFNHFLRPVRDRGHDHDKDCGDHDDDDDWDDHHGRGRDWHK
jgi:hypothetical protein